MQYVKLFEYINETKKIFGKILHHHDNPLNVFILTTNVWIYRSKLNKKIVICMNIIYLDFQ